MNELADLAQAILAHSPLSEAQAKLYAAVHVVMNGVAYGARQVGADLIDLLDDRVDNEPYVVPTTATPIAPADEMAVMRKQLADLQKAFAAQTTPAPAVNTTTEPPYVHGGGN